jgi:hypothetical protein
VSNEQTPAEVGSNAQLGRCSHCGFALPPNSSGLRHFGTHTAHQEAECLRLLHAEIDGLRDAVRSARADEAHCWARRVDGLTAQLRELDARYMALLKAVADGKAMQPSPPIYVQRLTPVGAGDGNTHAVG